MAASEPHGQCAVRTTPPLLFAHQHSDGEGTLGVTSGSWLLGPPWSLPGSALSDGKEAELLVTVDSLLIEHGDACTTSCPFTKHCQVRGTDGSVLVVNPALTVVASKAAFSDPLEM